MYDTIIIGMGPAGISAGIYAKRSKLNTLILEKSTPGGLLNKIKVIDNYPGFSNVSGPDLAFNMFNHINKLGVDYKIEEVTNLVKEGNIFKVITNKSKYTAKTVILSSGNEVKENNKFSFSKCAICDAPLYKDKSILVLGDNSLINDTLYLSEFAKDIIVITKDKLENKELLNKENIIIYESTFVENINEENNLYLVKTSNGTFTVDGIFTFFKNSLKPRYLENINLEYQNNRVVSKSTKTNIEGLFVCGDLSKKELYQVVTAVSEGAVAAIKVNEYVKGWK